MAELLQKAKIPEFTSSKTIYLSPEKTIPIGERLLPWHHLHHPGYWYQQAIKHHYLRCSYALAMPDEDRSSPGSTPASKVAIRASTYDTYFCPEPHEENPLPGHKGVDHSSLVLPSFDKAVVEYNTRQQSRIVEDLKLQIAREHVRSEAWDDAFKVLFPLWKSLSFRKDGWWDIVEEVGCLLRSVAVKVGNGEAVLAVNWELMDSTTFQQSNSFLELGAGLAEVESPLVLEVKDGDIRSFLTAAYAFEQEEGKVGEGCLSQLSLSSSAWQISKPVIINDITIFYEGNIKTTVIRHQPNERSPKGTGIEKVVLRESASAEVSSVVPNSEQGVLMGESDLVLSPGQTRIFEFSIPLRESGSAKAVSAKISITNEKFDLKYTVSFQDSVILDSFWYDEAPRISKKRLVRADPCAIEIQPRPPKVDVHLLTPEEQYYTSERIVLELEINNGEDDDAVATLDVNFGGENPPAFTLKHSADEDDSTTTEESTSHAGFALGKISSGTSTKVRLTILPVMVPILYDLFGKVNYHLVSDPETPLSCTMSSRLDVLSPFEANFEMLPRVHSDPWPSYFNPDNVAAFQPDQPVTLDPKEKGLSQKWVLAARYASFATQTLAIVDVDIQVIRENGGLNCQIEDENSFESAVEIQPNGLEECKFNIYATKLRLEDRRAASIDLGLRLRWRRLVEGSPVNAITLPAQRFLVCSSEPRVMACATYSTAVPSTSSIHLEYTIENPSMHFLTFGLVMEPSDDFAFSGPKQMSLNLLPLSRQTISFELIPTVYGKWIQPQFVVRDKYFQKYLKVIPVAEGMKLDKKGVLVWVPPEEDGV